MDFDYGFKEGRQYGRGQNGYQIRDAVRMMKPHIDSDEEIDIDRPLDAFTRGGYNGRK